MAIDDLLKNKERLKEIYLAIRKTKLCKEQAVLSVARKNLISERTIKE